MTALSLERLVNPRRSATTTPRRTKRAAPSRSALITASIRAARELDSAVSPGAQLRVAQRFAARLAS